MPLGVAQLVGGTQSGKSTLVSRGFMPLGVAQSMEFINLIAKRM